jgi:isopenicillin N synthase-like dioxygenase
MKTQKFVLFLCLLVTPGVISITTVSISAWIRGIDANSEEWISTAQQVDMALSTDGAFLATDHHISHDVYSSAMNSAYALFSGDVESLNNVEVQGGGFMRGYIGFGKESGLQQYFEPKEGYSFGYNWRDTLVFDNNLQGPNVWPEGVDRGTVNHMTEMFSRSSNIAEVIVTNLAVYYELLTNSSLGIIVDGGDTISVMRLFHYFSVESERVRREEASGRIPIGSSPHTDWGLLTVILQESGTLGLQMQITHSNGSAAWIDVPPVDGSVVINGGDFLSMASRGRYRSPVHRVLSPAGNKDRMSYVYFYYPNYNTRLDMDILSVCSNDESGGGGEHNTLTKSSATISSIPTKPDESTGQKYILFGDYIMKKWEEVFRGTPK